MTEQSPYDVLGVRPQASDAEIRDAFRRLAKRHHPDLHPGDEAAELRFREVAAAYALLSPAAARRRFDGAVADRARGYGGLIPEEEGPSPVLTLLTFLTLLFLLVVIVYDRLPDREHPGAPTGQNGAFYLLLVLVPFFALMYGIFKSAMAWAARRPPRRE
ncbi:MAG TPA: J domain-containing protein [Stellaceae bacterium]|nr:J domain-containing protein [Stellaceae bacterium]